MYLLLDTATEINTDQAHLAEATTFPNPRGQDMPIAEEAQRYYKSGKPFLKNYLPYWAANFVDRTLILLIPVFGVLIPAVRVCACALHVSAQVAHRPLVRAAGGRGESKWPGSPDPRARDDYLSRLDTIDAEIRTAQHAELAARTGLPAARGNRTGARTVGIAGARRRSRTLDRTARRHGPWNARRTGVRYDAEVRSDTGAPRSEATSWLTYDPPPWPASSIPRRQRRSRRRCVRTLRGRELARRRRARSPRRSSCRTPASSIRDPSPPRRTRGSPPDANDPARRAVRSDAPSAGTRARRCRRSRRSRRRWATSPSIVPPSTMR